MKKKPQKIEADPMRPYLIGKMQRNFSNGTDVKTFTVTLGGRIMFFDSPAEAENCSRDLNAAFAEGWRAAKAQS